jgi:hypothetical protein
VRGGGDKGRRGREDPKEEKVLWIKEEGMRRESYFCTKLAKSCLSVTAGMTVAFLPESVNIKAKRKTKTEQRNILGDKNKMRSSDENKL